MTDKQIDILQLALTAIEVYWMTNDANLVRTADAALRDLTETEVQLHTTSATVQQ
jgi:hypothetical protein